MLVVSKVTGDEYSADEFNESNDELTNLITNSGQTPNDAIFIQVSKAIAAYAAGATFYNDGGVADAYVLTTPANFKTPLVYFHGMKVIFIPSNTNTGASTINVASLGVKSIKLRPGVDPQAGKISAGVPVELYFHFVNNVFYFSQIITPSTILDTKYLPTNPNTTFNGGVFQRSFLQEDTGSSGELWNKGLLTPGRVRLNVQVSGTSTAGTEAVSFRIVSGSTIFESSPVVIGTNLNNEISFLSFDISTGNVVDLDLSVTNLKSINASGGSNFEFLVNADVSAGVYYIVRAWFSLAEV